MSIFCSRCGNDTIDWNEEQETFICESCKLRMSFISSSQISLKE